ncbi:MAG: NAD(P)/FAD-dependent oxidoreductase [Chlamydiales bacterium]|nr:NAD(P)/FAD-dependent oxidoreductase [Chlamydiales bacterium]
MRKVDVIVLGAGISGSLTALLLSRKGYHVTIISQDNGTKNHLPESWVYNPPNSIKNLKLEENILSTLRKQSRSSFCSADGRFSIEMRVADTNKKIENGDLVQVDRNQFDQVLLRLALEAGADFFPASIIESCSISPSEVKICILKEGKSHEFTAPFIIDATGKRAFLSNHLHLPTKEVKLDARLAYFSHFEMQTRNLDEIRIVSIEGGYLFCIPISEQRLSIGCVLSEQIVDTNSSHDTIFDCAISLSPYATELIAGAKRVLPIIPAKNYKKICLEPASPFYRLVGDAAAFLDPFFCPGIDFAFFSAEQAVLSIEENSPSNYQAALMNWLEEAKETVYQKIAQSEWGALMRLFADPHLPFAVPLMLTQAFTQIVGKTLSLKEGMEVARRTYEISAD